VSGGVTLCPHCQTRFRVTEEQLRARQGMVRCGHCLHPFDAAAHLEMQSPQPAALADDAPVAALLSTPEIVSEKAAAPAQPPQSAPDEERTSHTEARATEPQPAPAEPEVATEPTAHDATDGSRTEALHDDLFPHAPPSWRVPEQKSPYRPLWLLGSLLLTAGLLLQLAVFFRSDLVVRFPSVKPLLSGYCQFAGCNIDLPRRPDLLSIEASELEPIDPEHPETVVLDALLHNLAPFAQTYPHLELTLADAQGTPLGRRIFRPADYLAEPENTGFGIAPKQEIAIRLYLNTSDLRPEGYRIALFYPK